MTTTKPRNHIVVIDGTQSRMKKGQETNAGLLYKLLHEVRNPDGQTLWYHPGIQGHGLWNWVTIASGWGINQTIRDAYTHLSRQYVPGDNIYLFGFSRGAYAVRSLAGMINLLGLLRNEEASQQQVRRAFAMYERQTPSPSMKAFCDTFCNQHVNIEAIGVWDTVKALGIEYPLLSHLAPMATEFHNDRIGTPVRYAFQALALGETRTAYRPVLWHVEDDWPGHLEQVWFRGAHSDVGGHVWKFPKARPLSNIPLIWMLERATMCGLTLPRDWRDRFPTDALAPKLGNKRGLAKFFLFRDQRKIGRYPSEYLHSSVIKYDPDMDLGIPVQESGKQG
jgi:uncharacterized protein (DUF2235 family)